jgi:hypothetical protein
LRRTIMSGMMGHSLAEDLAVVNNTLSTWSTRSVRKIFYSRNHRLILLITVLTAQIWDLRMLPSY